VSTLAVDNIGLLVTNDPALGTMRDAALVIEGERVAAAKCNNALVVLPDNSAR